MSKELKRMHEAILRENFHTHKGEEFYHKWNKSNSSALEASGMPAAMSVHSGREAPQATAQSVSRTSPKDWVNEVCLQFLPWFKLAPWSPDNKEYSQVLVTNSLSYTCVLITHYGHPPNFSASILFLSQSPYLGQSCPLAS